MNIVFVEPFFPSTQRNFVRGLAEVGATVIGIGEYPTDALDEQLKSWMTHYHQVPSVVDVGAMTDAVRWIQDKVWVDRLEATIESHTLTAAKVRENCTIPGTSVRTAWLCRDKPSMKEALRAAGVPTAASRAAHTADEVHEFANAVGYPLILKPRTGAGALDTTRVDNKAELDAALGKFGGQGVDSIAVEEFVEGHEGFYDTICVNGNVALDFVSHYYPNVLEAMRARWISPQFIATNRVDSVADYGQLRELGGSRQRSPGDRNQRNPHGVVLRPERTAVLRDRLPPTRRGRLGSVLGGQRHGHLPRVGQRHRARPHRCPPVPKPRRRHRRAAAGQRRSDHRLLRCRGHPGEVR